MELINFKVFTVAFFFFWGSLNASVKLSSPHVKKVLFSIEAGKVLANNTSSPEVFVRNQLKYLFGVLNEIDSGIDFPSTYIEIKSVRQEQGLLEIQYKAKGIFAWDIKKSIPKTTQFSLPLRGDEIGLTEFLNTYREKCAKKSSSLASFWNYYRPNKVGCPIKNGEAMGVVSVVAHLQESHASDGEREPNYRRIFEDNIFEITAVITKDDPLNPLDISIWDFNTLCAFFSKEAVATLKASNECHFEGIRDGQTLKSHVFLVDNFNTRPDLFLQKISHDISNSDIVSFNGHSGMGANVESWMRLYPVPKNKYQIVFLNSCDTFGYFNNDFFTRFSRANHVKNSSDYLDVILNANPNYFGTFADSNINIFNGLLGESSFYNVLKKLHVSQHSLLLHE